MRRRSEIATTTNQNNKYIKKNKGLENISLSIFCDSKQFHRLNAFFLTSLFFKINQLRSVLLGKDLIIKINQSI
jgi:hypothetical protein